jgi:DNA-nicking Smr family endonuclease
VAKDLLDLHGCKAEEVEPKVDNFLVQISQGSLKRARIMTGKGSGVVQKIVINYLKQANYQWEFEKLPSGKKNEGVLVLFLD